MHRTRCLLALALLPVLLVTGCSRSEIPRAAVSGYVTLDGQPLESGVVRFVPTGDTKGPAVSVTITDGLFDLQEFEGPVVGANRIEIEALHWLGFAMDDEAAFVAQVEGGQHPHPQNPVPERYNRRSRRVVEVSSASEDFTFSLYTDGRANDGWSEAARSY